MQSGQYLIRQTKRFHPYFSGKSQIAEETFDGFAPQANVIKRVGYFSSSAVSPYSSTFDEFWLESGNGTITLKSSRTGTETLSVSLSNMSGYNNLGEYKTLSTWNNFTVIVFDFLWLGGAILRLWIKNAYGFVLAHEFNYSGTSPDSFIASPNQPLRYEIVSTTGTGSLRYMCSQVATEGSVSEGGLSRYSDTGTTLITLAVTGTTYPIKAIRKASTYRDIGTTIESLDIMVSSANDRLIWSLQINPTLSAPLSFSVIADSGIEGANGNGTITISSAGTIMAGGSCSTSIPPSVDQLKLNFLAWLGGTISNTMDQYVLCGTPTSGSMNVYGGIGFKEYS